MTYTTASGKTFEVKETNGKFFYYSRQMRRWFPIKRSLVQGA